MNTLLQKTMMAVLVALLSLQSYAYDVEIDGIYYYVVPKVKVAVVTSGDSEYTGDVVIPPSFEHEGETYNVTSIANSAFVSCRDLTSVTIPNSVTSIGGYAFWGCRGLTSVTIPNSVASIDECVFQGCDGLISVTIPNSVTSIGKEAFSSCSGLTAVNITDLAAWCNISFWSDKSNPLSNAHHLFLNGEEIKDLVIPGSVTSIGEYAFSGCSGLTSVTIPNSVTSIGNGAFYQCSGLTSVHITDLAAWCNIIFDSNPFLYAPHHLFLNGEEIKDLVIPSSITSIGENTFSGCSGLASVTIPNSVTSIAAGALYGCSGLTSVTLPNSIASIASSAFRGCSGLTSVTIPNSVTEIDSYAFSGCRGLTSVTIPNRVRSIGEYAFSGCRGMTFVTIGSGTRNIHTGAFQGCDAIEDIYCYAKRTPSLGDDVFRDAHIKYATLHVPDASFASYTAADVWKEFGDIVTMSGETPVAKKCAIPSISYQNGELQFSCETEGAEFISEITDEDIKKNYASKVQLTVTYNISVYATAEGYEKSDVATATLCWIDSDPKTEDIANGVKELKSMPVLIQSNDGVLTITSEGNTETTPIQVYNTAGQMTTSTSIREGMAILDTSMKRGEIAIVKIGEKSVKVMLK